MVRKQAYLIHTKDQKIKIQIKKGIAMLLILTASFDGTGDLLLSRLGNQAFRLNFDLFNEYHLELSSSGWSITNPAGQNINSETVTGIFWWKVTSYRAHADEFINEEIKYIFRELYCWGIDRCLAKGVPPDFHNRHGKISILAIAKSYFDTPETLVTWGFKSLPYTKTMVAKSLSSSFTSDNQVLFTSPVNPKQLDPKYPWYLQDKIDATYDVTTFICGKQLFGFKRDRSSLKGLDWRQEQDFSGQGEEWFQRIHTEQETSAILDFCAALEIDWGRIDFLEKANGELVFLEYNANGQWVFLDYLNKYGLVDTVVEYLTNKKSGERLSTIN